MAAPPPKPAASPHPGHDALGARVPRGTGWGEVRGKAGQSGGERARKKKKKKKKRSRPKLNCGSSRGTSVSRGGSLRSPRSGGGAALHSLPCGRAGEGLTSGAMVVRVDRAKRKEGRAFFFFKMITEREREPSLSFHDLRVPYQHAHAIQLHDCIVPSPALLKHRLPRAPYPLPSPPPRLARPGSSKKNAGCRSARRRRRRSGPRSAAAPPPRRGPLVRARGGESRADEGREHAGCCARGGRWLANWLSSPLAIKKPHPQQTIYPSLCPG